MENQTATFVEESPESRRARLRQMGKDESEARAKQIDVAQAPTRNVNAEYFTKEAERAAQIAANKPVAALPKTKEQVVAENSARYPFPEHNPQPIRDEAMEASPAYVQELHGYTPVKLKPSVALRPEPAQDPYGFKAAPPQDRPLSGADQRNAELQLGPTLVRPTKPCPNCGEPVEPHTAWHRLSNGKACILPGGEDLARRERV